MGYCTRMHKRKGLLSIILVQILAPSLRARSSSSLLAHKGVALDERVIPADRQVSQSHGTSIEGGALSATCGKEENNYKGNYCRGESDGANNFPTRETHGLRGSTDGFGCFG